MRVILLLPSFIFQLFKLLIENFLRCPVTPGELSLLFIEPNSNFLQLDLDDSDSQ